MPTRRIFLADLGRTTVGLLVFGLAACADGRDSGETESTAPPSASPAESSPWARVDLGFVSAYVIARDGEGVLVDTGVEGSDGAIADVLGTLGLGWSDVGHVVVTHRHPDHQGSLPAVAESTADAKLWAGRGDVDAITAPRPIEPVVDGDRIVDLEVIETPGHTPGHISLLHDEIGLLIAGDALNGADGAVAGPNPRFTSDMDEALASARKLGELTFEQIVFGHGAPIGSGADAAVAAYLDGL